MSTLNVNVATVGVQLGEQLQEYLPFLFRFRIFSVFMNSLLRKTRRKTIHPNPYMQQPFLFRLGPLRFCKVVQLQGRNSMHRCLLLKCYLPQSVNHVVTKQEELGSKKKKWIGKSGYFGLCLLFYKNINVSHTQCDMLVRQKKTAQFEITYVYCCCDCCT